MATLRFSIVASLSVLIMHLPASPADSFSLDIGLCASAGYTALALSATAGIQPRIGACHFPIFLRVDPIFGAGMPTTIALGAGVEYAWKSTR